MMANCAAGTRACAILIVPNRHCHAGFTAGRPLATWSPAEGDMVNGQNHVNYVVRGTGDPTLIFVHGFACSLDNWEEQLRGLSPSFRCVALDLPGHGGSATPDMISIEML